MGKPIARGGDSRESLDPGSRHPLVAEYYRSDRLAIFSTMPGLSQFDRLLIRLFFPVTSVRSTLGPTMARLEIIQLQNSSRSRHVVRLAVFTKLASRCPQALRPLVKGRSDGYFQLKIHNLTRYLFRIRSSAL
jgi:hypothetical protein